METAKPTLNLHSGFGSLHRKSFGEYDWTTAIPGRTFSTTTTVHRGMAAFDRPAPSLDRPGAIVPAGLVREALALVPNVAMHGVEEHERRFAQCSNLLLLHVHTFITGALLRD